MLARQALDLGHSLVKAGLTTDQIDVAVHEFIIANNAYPSPYNYYKSPKSLCTSVNEVICHGIPDGRPLQNGDIVNLDVTVFKDGFRIDLKETYLVGEVAESSRFLVTKAYECLEKAIAICKPGTMYREVGNVISKFIEANGYASCYLDCQLTELTAGTASETCSIVLPTSNTTPETRLLAS